MWNSLIKERNKKGLTQAELAKEMSLKQSTIAMWEIGINKQSLNKLIKIAQYFNVSTDYLLGLKDTPI